MLSGITAKAEIFFDAHKEDIMKLALIGSLALFFISLGVFIGGGYGGNHGTQFVDRGRVPVFKWVGDVFSVCGYFGMCFGLILAGLVIANLKDPPVAKIKEKKLASFVGLIALLAIGSIIVGVGMYLSSRGVTRSPYFSYEKNAAFFPDKAVWDKYQSTITNFTDVRWIIVSTWVAVVTSIVFVELWREKEKTAPLPQALELAEQSQSHETSRVGAQDVAV